RAYAKPGGLHVHHTLKFAVREVHVDWRPGCRLEFLGAANMVDVGVSDHDGGHGELVVPEDLQNAVNLVAGIDHHGLPRGFVAKDGTVALQHADGKHLVDHKASILT